MKKSIGNPNRIFIIFLFLLFLDILFSDIDVQFLEDFGLYLKQTGNAQSTIHGRMKAIRALVYKAIDRGIIQQSQNPFFSYKLKSARPNTS